MRTVLWEQSCTHQVGTVLTEATQQKSLIYLSRGRRRNEKVRFCRRFFLRHFRAHLPQKNINTSLCPWYLWTPLPLYKFRPRTRSGGNHPQTYLSSVCSLPTEGPVVANTIPTNKTRKIIRCSSPNRDSRRRWRRPTLKTRHWHIWKLASIKTAVFQRSKRQSSPPLPKGQAAEKKKKTHKKKHKKNKHSTFLVGLRFHCSPSGIRVLDLWPLDFGSECIGFCTLPPLSRSPYLPS